VIRYGFIIVSTEKERLSVLPFKNDFRREPLRLLDRQFERGTTHIKTREGVWIYQYAYVPTLTYHRHNSGIR
jgi:hypothetical protein